MNPPYALVPLRVPGLGGFAVALACVFVLGLAGCATFVGGYDLVTKNDAPLYLQGPGQEVPDTYLDKGTRVKMLQSIGGYARVETTRGLRGFVRISDLERGPEQVGTGAYGGSSTGSPGMF